MSGTPFAGRRYGLGFEDNMGELAPGTLPGNGEIAYVGAERVDKVNSTANSGSVNALHGLSAPDKQRGVSKLTNSREKPPYEGLSKRARFCSICRRAGHKRTTCAERGDAPKKPRKPGRCKKCGMEGHRRTTCTRSKMMFQEYGRC